MTITYEQLIGAAMLLLFFGALLVFVARQLGWKDALAGACISLSATSFLFIAVSLIKA